MDESITNKKVTVSKEDYEALGKLMNMKVAKAEKQATVRHCFWWSGMGGSQVSAVLVRKEASSCWYPRHQLEQNYQLDLVGRIQRRTSHLLGPRRWSYPLVQHHQMLYLTLPCDCYEFSTPDSCSLFIQRRGRFMLNILTTTRRA